MTLDILNLHSPEWMTDPARPCAQEDPERWYDPAADLHVEAKRKPRGWAQRLCAACPLATKDACLSYALDNREEWGVWGGTTATERAQILRGSNVA